jgi:hypothetical protein
MVKTHIDHKPIEIDHVDMAILSKVNELAAGYGIKPHQFGISYFRSTGAGKHARLSFDTVDEAAEAKSFRMLDALGLDGNYTLLEGTVGEVIDALDAAIDLLPRRQHRRR